MKKAIVVLCRPFVPVGKCDSSSAISIFLVTERYKSNSRSSRTVAVSDHAP